MKHYSPYILIAGLSIFSSSCGEKSNDSESSKATQPDTAKQNVVRVNIELQQQRNQKVVDIAMHSLRQKETKYSSSYQLIKVADSSLQGSVKIIPSELYTESPGYQLSPREKPLQILPIWQRETVSKLRENRQKIYDEGAREGEAVLAESPEKRREWLEKWNDRVRNQLNKLKRRESATLRKAAPEPTEDEVSSLLARLNDQNPELGESDLPVLEFLLPPLDELETYSSSKLDDHVSRLLEAHKILANQFPQSAGLKNQF